MEESESGSAISRSDRPGLMVICFGVGVGFKTHRGQPCKRQLGLDGLSGGTDDRDDDDGGIVAENGFDVRFVNEDGQSLRRHEEGEEQQNRARRGCPPARFF